MFFAHQNHLISRTTNLLGLGLRISWLASVMHRGLRGPDKWSTPVQCSSGDSELAPLRGVSSHPEGVEPFWWAMTPRTTAYQRPRCVPGRPHLLAHRIPLRFYHEKNRQSTRHCTPTIPDHILVDFRYLTGLFSFSSHEFSLKLRPLDCYAPCCKHYLGHKRASQDDLPDQRRYWSWASPKKGNELHVRKKKWKKQFNKFYYNFC